MEILRKIQARRLWDCMRPTLSGQLFPPNQRFVEKIFVLPKQSYQIDVPIKNPSNAALLAIKNIFFIQNKSCSTNFFSSNRQ
ncbi:hypothetical protein [Candidatus Protochlamydia sp. R18]|uniref:hypothetical protein n=1 Tax=Candidatus Protochlamydia sp. R18 TaxID=1353977 RepID=UPI0005A683A0|nr:hypothetical protein [Candidatus Protochlamydia sp. R18]